MRILILKLSLLLKISSDGGSIGSHIYSSLTAKDSQSLRILQECKSLEDKLGCLGATNTVLNAEASMKEVKRRILKVDWDACLSTASQHDSTSVAAKISSSVSWMKLWTGPWTMGHVAPLPCKRYIVRSPGQGLGRMSVQCAIPNQRKPTLNTIQSATRPFTA